MNVNDKVIERNCISKIVYIIEDINNEKVTICGMNYRIKKIVNIDTIELATTELINEEKEKAKKYFYNITAIRKVKNTNHLPGVILHIDGDKEYLSKCLELYKEMNIYAYGVNIKENKIADEVENLIIQTNPDIIVITGHDLYNEKGLKEIENYSNTINYVQAIRKIREKKSKYDICIIAGACQSNFEALIASGADFASSPKRINIHTFDPAIIAIKVATTSFMKPVNIQDIYRNIENGKDAYGAVETLGKMRLIYD